jgi:hypothetical protein
MNRALLVTVALAAVASGARAEETVVHLDVRPMPAPKPALQYQLLPELRELQPGNAAHNYLKCFMEQRNFFFGKGAVEERARYQTMPLADLPVHKLRDYGHAALQQADWAARLDTIDWQTLPRLQSGDRDVLPEGLGSLQVLAAALQVRFRVELAERRFDDALRTAKTIFALARHLGEHPTEIANHVGLWIAHLGLRTLEEAVQQPGCPNLYWALTDLPCPLIDLRKGAQGSRTLIAAELRPLRADVAMTESELDQFVSRLSGVLSFAREQAGRPPRSLRAQLAAQVKDAERVRAARCRLTESGRAADLIQRLPPLQVILLDGKRDYEIQRDERLKLLAVPFWQMEATLEREEREQGPTVFVDLLPQVLLLRRTQARLEQQIALLRQVEALRCYAADHAGRLPEQLTDLPFPLPLDPVTGKPFLYTVDGTTAHLRGSLLAEAPVHYEVAVQR